MFRSRSLVSVANRVARTETSSSIAASKPRWYQAAAAASVNIEPPLVPVVPGGGISHWKTEEGVSFTRENVLDLLYGKTPLIREPGFMTPEECYKYEEALSPLVTPYKHNTGPVLRKVGLAQFEYQAQSQADVKNRADEQEQYFKDVKEWEGFHEKLATERGMDAWFRVFNRMARLFPDWEVKIASESPDKQYFSGIFRALNDATHLHCDFSPYDSRTEDWIINEVECQIVFNLYLAPVKNGRTTVFDVQWTPEALRYRDPNSYGYSYKLVAGARKVVCEPSVGSLCMFNSRNMHEVEPVTPEEMPALGLSYRPRLTLSSFMGLLPRSKTGGKPQLIFWS